MGRDIFFLGNKDGNSVGRFLASKYFEREIYRVRRKEEQNRTEQNRTEQNRREEKRREEKRREEKRREEKRDREEREGIDALNMDGLHFFGVNSVIAVNLDGIGYQAEAKLIVFCPLWLPILAL